MAPANKKKIKPKSETSIFWKVVLIFGKWSPNWEGPFLVKEVYDGNAYRLMDLVNGEHAKPINGKFLKKHMPSVSLT